MQKHDYKADSSITITVGLDYGTFHMINVPIQINFAVVNLEFSALFYGSAWHPDGWQPMGAVPEMRTGMILSTRTPTSDTIRTSLA